ncbi:hypothetical protein [Haliangium ochraceum]|uniref:Uncharacterized protein n=1 Tax=Haliangium ochraceum (strain DSM 14365 / JCM 11303 / SMP-2) TaxID=502025 RepID=D0LR50_HALO1|nr:hypothetical protein [Haliangium ochraceum]ACY15558.1 conserved hypothetical protein [Haliangium ochraceum DSM 14365]
MDTKSLLDAQRLARLWQSPRATPATPATPAATQASTAEPVQAQVQPPAPALDPATALRLAEREIARAFPAGGRERQILAPLLIQLGAVLAAEPVDAAAAATLLDTIEDLAESFLHAAGWPAPAPYAVSEDDAES